MDTTVLLLLLFCVHLRCRATSAPDIDSASLLLLIVLFCFVATLCVNKDVYIEHNLYKMYIINQSY